MRETGLLYLRTGARCAAFLLIPWLITRYWSAPDYPHLFFVATLSSIAYALPMWWLEFDGIGADRLMAPIRNARRLLSAR
jgi:hypothetical protein